MLIGDKSTFAIESVITQAYERLSFRALGCFVIHIGGRRYGVYKPDASMLACSLDEVEHRIAQRGGHTAPFSTELDAGKIADAYGDATYAPDQENELFFGIPHPGFSDFFDFRNQNLRWHGGDETFDDGSVIFHFDIEDRIRLIGFNSSGEGYHHDPATLSDVWLEAEEFYDILQNWRNSFLAEWNASSKISASEDGAVSPMT
ncbi:immunity 42 family protein [Pedosphaera parvula]|uniref:Uncharacterized protein n=1 Tax=Pedosphaera parvula (strain Ellin514) TaxID=320771 RepID=B9XQE5_PEDPL|nr:immunity 42 family protein [Pedosphaera parvula]EEF57969.1 hypothetical protein Cflav_PD1144 [Pedosphaera parvula Ellin514]